MPIPDLTPEQLEQLNAISGLRKSKRRNANRAEPESPVIAPVDSVITNQPQSIELPADPSSPEPEKTDNEPSEAQQRLDSMYTLARQWVSRQADKLHINPDEDTDSTRIEKTPSDLIQQPDSLNKADSTPTQTSEAAATNGLWRDNIPTYSRFEPVADAVEPIKMEIDKDELERQLQTIYNHARERANKRRNELLAAMDKGMDKASLWSKGWTNYAKSQMLRSPDALGGDDSYLMRATERALKALNQKTEKDKQAGDKSSGIAREIFDWGTLGDLVTLGYGELGENLAATRALKKAAKGEQLSPTEQDIIDLLRYGDLINQYIAQRDGPTTGAKVGGGIAASLPYMAGFGATSKFGSGAAKAIGKAVLKKEAKTLAAKGLRKLGEYTVSAAAMTPLQAGTYSNYHERTQGQYEIKDDGEVVQHPIPKYELMYKRIHLQTCLPSISAANLEPE